MNGPVGWFPDPDGGNGLRYFDGKDLRYFDGKEWTQIAPPPVALPAPAAPPVNVPWLVLLCLSPFWLPVAIGIWVAAGPGPILIGVLVIAVIVALVQKNIASARAQAELAMRAEVENEYDAKGDPRGTYGRYIPPEDLR